VMDNEMVALMEGRDGDGVEDMFRWEGDGVFFSDVTMLQSETRVESVVENIIDEVGSNSYPPTMQNTTSVSMPVYHGFYSPQEVNHYGGNNYFPQEVNPSGGYHPQQIVYEPQHSVYNTVTLNPNNFVGPVSNIRYIKEDIPISSRKRTAEPGTSEPETQISKRAKNREAARRWRQGKKEQLVELQEEVFQLKSRIDDMQIDMDVIRNENFYLKKELERARNGVTSSVFTGSTNRVPPTSNTSFSNRTNITSSPYGAMTGTNPMTSINVNGGANGLQYMTTPSLVLLCVFLFSLAIFLPVLYNGTNAFQESHPLLLAVTETARHPRVLVDSKFPLPQYSASPSLLKKTNHLSTPSYSLFKPTPAESFPNQILASVWNSFTGEGVNSQQMKKSIASGVRMDRTFL